VVPTVARRQSAGRRAAAERSAETVAPEGDKLNLVIIGGRGYGCPLHRVDVTAGADGRDGRREGRTRVGCFGFDTSGARARPCVTARQGSMASGGISGGYRRGICGVGDAVDEGRRVR